MIRVLLLVTVLCVSCTIQPLIQPVDKRQREGAIIEILALDTKGVEKSCGAMLMPSSCGCAHLIGDRWVVVYNKAFDVCQQHEYDHILYGPKHYESK